MMNNKSKIISLLWVFVSMLALQNISAAEYTISTANELSKLSLSPGDVVIMTDGTWTNQVLSFKGNGTESQPITLRAETQGEVILTGYSRLSMAGEYLVVDGLTFQNGELEGDAVIQFRTSSSNIASHCRLTNTAIIDYNPWDPAEEYKWISLYGQYNQVDHCSFVGKNHQGAMMVVWLDGSPNHHRINNNYFADIPELGQNGGETIRIGTSTNSMTDSYTIVENNLFEACDGEIEIISNKSCENIYRYNTFLNCEGMLTLRHGNRCEVYSNFFFGDVNKRSAGVRIIGEDHKVYNNYFQDLMSDGFRSAICLTNGVPDSPLNRYFQVKNAEVVNNTIVNCKSPITIGAGKSDELSLPPLNTSIINNVIADYADVTSKAVHYEDTPDGITYTQNIIYALSSLGDTPEEVDNSDPKLAAADDFYRPESNSPLIGFGATTVSYLNNDIEGQARATTNDAGCDQVSEEAISNQPLSSEDIGTKIGVEYDREDDGGGEEDLGVQLTIIEAIASTEQNEDGKVNIAAHAIDGMLSTRWSGEGIGEYIDLFLAEQSKISYIKIAHFKGDERTSDFHLLAWDNQEQAFDTLLSNVTSEIHIDDFSTYDFDDVISDKVRLVGLGYSSGTGTWNSYSELELWRVDEETAIKGADKINQLQLALYPNPSYGTFYVQNCKQGHLAIFTLSGTHVYSQLNISSETLISANLQRGIYLVTVDCEQQKFVERLVMI